MNLRLDTQAWTAVIAGLLFALITLFSSYRHVTIPGYGTITIDQQIGLYVLLASLATLVVEAQLASRRRYRERDLADRERQRAARRAQRQDRCTLAQLEFQFDPTAVTDSDSPT